MQPLLYLAGLARAVGARIFTGTRAASIDASRGLTVITSDHFRISAGAVVIATNSAFGQQPGALPPQILYRTFVLAMRIPPDAIPPALYWDGYWDADTPYHYVRLAASTLDGPNDLLVVGGEDEEVSDPVIPVDLADRAARFDRLHSWAVAHFPCAGEITHAWHGYILEPDGELAFIGRLDDANPSVYVVSGDSGNGMTYAAIAGMMLPELIQGRDHPWAAVYSPTRARIESHTRRALARA
jgi:glycine/D-amino acid oxidase-like deaminating enzyme